MKRILLLVFIIILFTAPCALATEANVYKNQYYHFRMIVPDGYKIIDTRDGAEILAPQGFLSFIFWGNVTNHKINSDIMTQEIEDSELNMLVNSIQEKFPTMQLIDKHHLVISNHEAVQITLMNDKMYTMDCLFLYKNRFLIIAMSGLPQNFDKDQENFNQVISTFTFVD